MKECKRQEIIDQFWKDIKVTQSSYSISEVIWYKGQFYGRAKTASHAKQKIESLLNRLLREAKV